MRISEFPIDLQLAMLMEGSEGSAGHHADDTGLTTDDRHEHRKGYSESALWHLFRA